MAESFPGRMIGLYDYGMVKVDNRLVCLKATLRVYPEPNCYRMAESFPGLGIILYDCGMGKVENLLGCLKAILYL